MGSMNALIKKPSAWVPIALSLLAVVAMATAFVVSGPPVRQPDEGTGAHLFQIWLVLEVFMIAYFGVMWLPAKPRQALVILGMQIVGVLIVCAPVRFFNL